MGIAYKVVELLAISEPMTVSDIAKELGVEKREVENAVKLLKRGRKIFSPRKHIYAVK